MKEVLECFKMQPTPEYIDSEKDLKELKNDLIATIETVWKKLFRDPKPLKGLDENTIHDRSFKDCCDLVKTLVKKSAQPPRSAEES
jgi:hypothetical protein